MGWGLGAAVVLVLLLLSASGSQRPCSLFGKPPETVALTLLAGATEKGAGFRSSMVNDLKVVEDKEDWGMFIDSCFTHCQTLYGISWNSPISPRLGNKARSLKCTIRLSALSLTHHVAAWIDIFWLPFCDADHCRGC
ncbi:hypothetical protein ACQ4PT_048822 [Festuca glaucescens]